MRKEEDETLKKSLDLATIQILHNQEGWVGGVGQMIMQ